MYLCQFISKAVCTHPSVLCRGAHPSPPLGLACCCHITSGQILIWHIHVLERSASKYVSKIGDHTTEEADHRAHPCCNQSCKQMSNAQCTTMDLHVHLQTDEQCKMQNAQCTTNNSRAHLLPHPRHHALRFPVGLMRVPCHIFVPAHKLLC